MKNSIFLGKKMWNLFLKKIKKHQKYCKICIENVFEIAFIQVSFLQFFIVFYWKYIFLLLVVFQCRNYSEITVESGTQLKSVIFTMDIFAVFKRHEPDWTLHITTLYLLFTIGVLDRDQWDQVVWTGFVISYMST